MEIGGVWPVTSTISTLAVWSDPGEKARISRASGDQTIAADWMGPTSRTRACAPTESAITMAVGMSPILDPIHASCAPSFGRGTKLALADASGSDAGAISILEDGPKNLMFGTEPSEIRTLSALRPSQSQRVGTRVCRSGGSSGWTCGTVTRADENVTMRGALIRHTWWTDFPSAEGDSGSPVIDEEGALMGIVIATTKSESLYLTVDAVSAVLGVRPCLDGACR